MTILTIDDITRKENFIYYRREFHGNAQLELLGKKHISRIEFTIETAPTGKKDIRITLVDSIDYPLVPIIQNLKQFILDLDNEDKLP